MSNEPKAGMNLDPEMLAAYIDHRLTPGQRAAVEAQLANDPDSYAILVETLKAQEALESAPAVRQVTKVRRWTIAGVLAVAAAVVLVVRLQPDLLQSLRGERSDPRLERLIAAIERERPIEPRLTGGFKYAPLRPVTRGTGADDNLALLAAAGELQRIARDQPVVENQHASAVALLLTGRVDQAIDLLEQVDRRSANARYRSDLAAAYAARAQQQGRADDWVRSLDAAERAIALDGNLSEAWFNRALALEKMFLRERASEAWQDYLRHDPNSDWATEARSRSQAVPQSWDQRRKQLDELPAGATAPADLVTSNPQLVREWIEEYVLSEWARSVLDGNGDAAAIRLKQAGDNAELVAKAQPQTTFIEAVRAIAGAGGPRRLAQAHLDFIEARRLYSQGAFANSADFYQRAYPALASARSPFARTCQHYMALLPYFRGELTQAAANLAALENEFHSDPIAEARRRWMLGIIAVGQGRYESAVVDYRFALAAFEATNESEGLAGVHSAMGEVLRDLGDREWWQHLRKSTELTPLVRVGRRHGILVIGTQGLLAAGYPAVARHYQEETLRNALDGGVPAMISESFQWMYAVLQRQGARDAAAQTLARAREWVGAISDEGLRKRQEAELWSLEADSTLGSNPMEASAVAKQAIEQFTREGRTRRLPQLYLQLAKSKARLNDLDGARDAIDLGLASVEQQRVDVREARLRVSYFEDKWGLVEEGLAERLASSEVTAAQSLMFLDHWRRPSVFRSTSSAVQQQERPLAPNVAVVAYAMLPNRLVIWVVRASKVQRMVVDVERARIESLVLSLKQMLGHENREQGSTETLAELSGILLAPVWTAISDASDIAISPDGVIGEVPFAALSSPTGDQLLVERAAVVMVPSISAILNGGTGLPIRPIGRVLVAAVSRTGEEELPPLPGSVAEANGVGAVYGADRADVHVDDLGVDDFVRLAPSADIIHVAAHASANPLLPHLSRIFLKPTAARPSGVLTAAEISAMKLRAQLVVLSACDTASGTPTRSEGVIGLASAFIAAGATSVVASLWPADDYQAVGFQEHFHQAINSGASVAQALRESQLWARAQQRTSSRPWMWATWIVTQTQL